MGELSEFQQMIIDLEAQGEPIASLSEIVQTMDQNVIRVLDEEDASLPEFSPTSYLIVVLDRLQRVERALQMAQDELTHIVIQNGPAATAVAFVLKDIDDILED